MTTTTNKTLAPSAQRGIVIGTGMGGVPVSLDGTQMCLVTGKPGAGKTRMLATIADRARTFGYEVVSVADSSPTAVLNRIDAECNRRFDALTELDLSAWWLVTTEQQREHDLAPIMVLIDDLYWLCTPTDRSDIPRTTEIMSLVARLSRGGRAAGVHIVAAAERMLEGQKEWLPTNFGTRIVLGRSDVTSIDVDDRADSAPVGEGVAQSQGSPIVAFKAG